MKNSPACASVGENTRASDARRSLSRRLRAGETAELPATRRVTIADVAAEAQVSVSAVSKVMRDAYGVSPRMRERVTAAIERLGYRPHAGARAMRGRSYTVGIMLTSLSTPYQSELAEGISDELEASPYQGLIAVGGASAERQQRRIESLVDRQVDGLILIAPTMAQPWLEKLAANLPAVVIARHGGAVNYDTVVDDDYEGAGLMVDHLVDLGHKRIVHTSHPSGGLERPSILSHTARRDGYVAAMKRHGLDADVIETTYTEQGGHQAGVQALSAPTPPTAIFGGADIAALGVLRAAEELGLRVPGDVTVAGYDNIYSATIGRVSLTTVDQSGHLTGSKSARLLLERISGRRQAVHYVLGPRLVPRATSAAPPREPAGRPRRQSQRSSAPSGR